MKTLGQERQRRIARQTATAPVKKRTGGVTMHRIRHVRHQQGLTIHGVARKLKTSVDVLRQQEEETADLRLSDLYRWQEALDVPVGDLLVEGNEPLSAPVLKRARLLKLMKTAAAIQEQCQKPQTRRMANTLIEQLVEIMPELEGVAPWHSVGKRRSLDDYGRIVYEQMPSCIS
jgi:transcriptional regulator with XRE-family HTH domain